MIGVNGLWGYIVPCFMFSCAVSSFALNRQETLSADSLTADDRKIVALLERIQVKMKALSEREKVEFVAKMADYRDKFESSLDKVEKIPGMMGLDVTNLRLSLGLVSYAEDMEEVHIEDVPWYEDRKQSKSFGSVESMVRKATTPKNVKSSAKKEPTMNDLYDALLQLLELTIVQVLQKAEEDDSVDVILDPFEDKTYISAASYDECYNGSANAKLYALLWNKPNDGFHEPIDDFHESIDDFHESNESGHEPYAGVNESGYEPNDGFFTSVFYGFGCSCPGHVHDGYASSTTKPLLQDTQQSLSLWWNRFRNKGSLREGED